MIRLKTAVLLACSLKTGALLGGASQEDAGNLYAFGINIGPVSDTHLQGGKQTCYQTRYENPYP